MIFAILVLQAAVVVAFGLRVDTPYGTLNLLGRTKRGIEASFTSPEGDGIHIQSTPDSLEVKALDGTNLISFANFKSAAQSYGERSRRVVFQLLEDAYVEENWRTYRYSANVEIYSQIQEENLVDPHVAVKESYDALTANHAMRLLEPAARALGQDLGIIGRDEPAAMTFYLPAMVLTEARRKQLRARVAVVLRSNPWSAYINKRRANTQGNYPDCDMTTCPPCEEDECLGGCGYGCSCWSWACGDCCYHEGCRDHDICCRYYGVFSTACLGMYTFKCDFPYSCK
jgi:hypothetical protein